MMLDVLTLPVKVSADHPPVRYTAEVTAEDIRSGPPGEPDACPVKRAMSRATGNQYISVVGSVAYVGGCFPRKIVSLPFAVGDWIVNFDRNHFGQPITFEFEVPA